MVYNSDKASLDIFWLRDESLEESDNLPDPDVLAQEIGDDLESALEQFREIAADLGADALSEKDQYIRRSSKLWNCSGCRRLPSSITIYLS
jgi:hypothetical protein